ncbi:hypothetical protein WBG99_14190 [Streptomyces sp. TG1A-60]|uniref:hypothetical protein n=1 Tax=Streptomyces sp. TG1A-60 TaxID=3129111 RepID=UPI0030D4AC6F
MSRDVEAVRALLPRDDDPASDQADGAGLTERAERELALLRSSAARQRSVRARRGPGRRSVLGAAAVLAGASVVVLNGGLPWPGEGGGASAVAVTPPVLFLSPVPETPEKYLRDMAKRVEVLPEEHSGGSYQYSKTWGWWLNTAGDVPGGVANAAVPTVTESWVDRQGGGRKLSTYGDPIFPNPDQEREAREAGLVSGKKIDDAEYGPGQFPGGSPWQEIEPFAQNPDGLSRQLETVNWEGGLIISGVSDMLTYASRSGPIAPGLRAAALRVLADAPGLRVSTTTTWKGSKVVAVTQEEVWKGSTMRTSVFFDPTTGYPMGSEEALFGSPLSLNVRVPATLAVTETLKRRTVSTTDERS